MAKYITSFQTLADYQAAQLDYPNVSLIESDGSLIYEKVEPPFSGKYKFTLDDSSVITAECDSTSAITTADTSAYKSTMVEAEIGDCVTSIGNAFRNCRGLTSCTIGSSVTSIANDAFNSCSGLTSIDIPDSVTSIGSNAFRNCSGLTSCTIGSGVTSINNQAFNGCSSLTSCTIGSGVTSIGSRAFRDCSSLTSITVNATLPPIISQDTFSNTNDCPIYVPCESVEAYKTDWSTYADRIQCVEGKYKFTLSDSSVITADCDSNSAITTTDTSAYQTTMVEAEIGNCVTSIDSDSFAVFQSLTSIDIPNSVTSIGIRAFNGCSSLTSIDIPDSVTSIGASAFDNCNGLTSVTIPISVTSIGDTAFSYCSSLTSIDIPDSVTSIGGNAFNSCSSLISVTVNATVPPTLGTNAFADTSCPILVPSQSVEAYKTAWSDYADRIQAIQ